MKKTKAILKQAFSSGFAHIMGAGALNKILTFANSLFVVRLISKGNYGVYSYAQSIFSLLCVINGIGMESALLQVCSEKHDDKELCNNIFSWGTKVYFFSSIFVSSLIGIGAFLFPFKLEGTGKLLLLMLFLPVLDGIKVLQLTKFREELNNKAYAYVSNIDTIALVVLSIGGAFWFGVIGIILARYISSFISIFCAVFFFKARLLTRAQHISSACKKDIWGIAMILALNNGMGGILSCAGTIILGHYVPNDEIIASYKVASTIPMALLFIPQYLMVYFSPLFARKKDDFEWIRKTYKKIFVCFSLFNFLMCGILYVFAPLFIQIVFGNEYLDAVYVFRIMLWAYFVQAIFRIPSANLLATQRKLWINLIMSTLNALINIILSCSLTPKYYSAGAAYAYLIPFVVSGIVLWAAWLIIIYKRKEDIVL